MDSEQPKPIIDPKPASDSLPENVRTLRSPVPESISPIRPQHPDPPKPKLTPSLTRPVKPDVPIRSTEALKAIQLEEKNLSPAEKAERAVDDLSQKMEKVAREYADGIINRDQFNAIYRRYSEQREIVERLLERNPESQAWQSVVQAGHTTFLMDQYAAKIISYAIYALTSGEQITLHGTVRLPPTQLNPIFAKVKSVVDQGHVLGGAWRQLKDRNWVLIVPGKTTVSVVIYSGEPALAQRKKAEDAHRDFERANDKALQAGDFDTDKLVFPHRALLET